MRALLVPVGGDRYAIELADVREVAEGPRVTPLPHAPETVLGIVNVRGTIVPLLDTGALLGVGGLGETRWAVVADSRRGPVALAASALPAIAELGSALGPAADARSAGRFATAEGVAVLLDLDALVEG